MNEDKQWAKAVEITNEAIQWVDYLTVSASLPSDAPDEAVRGVYDKVHQLRADGDRHHTMQEMYRYRMLYNAGLFNAWYKSGQVRVCKSWRHSDGHPVFGGNGWFIVVASLPTGQISNHYDGESWTLFDIPDVEQPPEYDGHTPALAAERLERFLAGCRKEKNG